MRNFCPFSIKIRPGPRPRNILSKRLVTQALGKLAGCGIAFICRAAAKLAGRSSQLTCNPRADMAKFEPACLLPPPLADDARRASPDDRQGAIALSRPARVKHTDRAALACRNGARPHLGKAKLGPVAIGTEWYGEKRLPDLFSDDFSPRTESQLETVFEPFTRLDVSRIRSIGGANCGLSVFNLLTVRAVRSDCTIVPKAACRWS